MHDTFQRKLFPHTRRPILPGQEFFMRDGPGVTVHVFGSSAFAGLSLKRRGYFRALERHRATCTWPLLLSYLEHYEVLILSVFSYSLQLTLG